MYVIHESGGIWDPNHVMTPILARYPVVVLFENDPSTGAVLIAVCGSTGTR